MNAKCTECGNTFKLDSSIPNDIIACPVCEANYIVTIKDGKTKLTEYIYETEDLGEL